MIPTEKPVAARAGEQAGSFTLLKLAGMGGVGWMILAFLWPTVAAAQG